MAYFPKTSLMRYCYENPCCDTPKLTWNVFEVRQEKIKFVFPYVVLFQQMRSIILCGRLHNHNTVHQSLQN